MNTFFGKKRSKPKKRKATFKPKASSKRANQDEIEAQEMEVEPEGFDPLYTELHAAAFHGNESSIREICRNSPELINAQSSKGRTPLMMAVLGNQEVAVYTLLELGADTHIQDHSEALMTAYDYCQQESEYKSFIRVIQCLTAANPTEFFHKMIHLGEFEEVKAVLESNPEYIESRDSQGNPPIFTAFTSGDMTIFNWLVSEGADIHVMLNEQVTLLDLAKDLRDSSQEGEQRYQQVKRLYEIDEEARQRIVKTLNDYIVNAQTVAKHLNKNLLVILGEIHQKLPIKRVAKALFKSASQLGIKAAYTEQPSVDFKMSPTQLKLHNRHDIEYFPVDLFRNHEPEGVHVSEEKLQKRDVAMAEEIKRLNRSGILVTGSDHLLGMYKHFKKDRQYYVLPINLTDLSGVKDIEPGKRQSFLCKENVIEVSRTGACSKLKSVLKKWNG